MRKINLIVGCGLSGATLAHLIAKDADEHVVIIDKKDHIAGHSYDYLDANGILIHKYGSHIFHTNNEEVWQFISKFTSFNQYMHKVIALVDGIETSIPFNFNTLYDLFPPSLANKIERKLLEKFEYNSKISILDFQGEADSDLQFLATYIYEKIFLHYTTKQWGKNPLEIDSLVTARVPIYLSKDNRYFQDKYQGIPSNGYTEIVSKLLDHENIELRLNTNYNSLKEPYETYDRIFYTGSIDEYFNYSYGMLPYRSVRFTLETHNREFYQTNAVINYPSNYDFTRIHEYKYYLNEKSEKTVIAKEYSEPFKNGINERYYPISDNKNNLLYDIYLNEASCYKKLCFLGRLGDYKYYNMDEAISRALEVYQCLYNKYKD